MRLSRRTVLGAAPWVVVATGCSAGEEEAPVPDMPWTDATALTEVEDAPHALATDGTSVFFTTGGSQVGENAVRVVPLDGSAPSRVLSKDFGDSAPGDQVVVEGDHLYVAAGATIHRVAIADGTTEVVVEPRPGSISGLTTDGEALWWSASQLDTPSAAELCRMPLAGGPIEILAAGVETEERPYVRDVVERRAVQVPGLTSVSDLVADTRGVLAASTLGVLRASPGATTQVLVPREEPVVGLALAGDTLYFLEVGGRTSLRAVPLAGGDVAELDADLDTTVPLVVGSDRAVGILRGGLGSGDSRVVAAPLAGGEARTLSTGRYAGAAVLLSGSTVVLLGDDRVWRIPLG